MAARAALRRAPRLPRQAYARATAYLADTLDWLNLWEANNTHESNELDVDYDTQQSSDAPQP